MSLFQPRRVFSSKVRIVFFRPGLDDDWEVEEIQGADNEPGSGRSEHDWIMDFATDQVNYEHFFDDEQVKNALRVAVSGTLRGWWTSSSNGEDYDEEFEVDAFEVLP